MFLVMRYLVHELGQSRFADAPFVDRPITQRFDADYEGDPPPWEQLSFDFSEE